MPRMVGISANEMIDLHEVTDAQLTQQKINTAAATNIVLITMRNGNTYQWLQSDAVGISVWNALVNEVAVSDDFGGVINTLS